MTEATFLVGDVFDRLTDIPDDSIDLVMTSPPFLALRSYLPEDHPDKHREIGSEPTPAEFIDTLLVLVAALDRVIAPHGSIAFELGDSYSSNGGTTDNRETSDGGTTMAPRRRGGGEGWPLNKSLALIPELFRVGLAYGINPLTGQGSPAGRWRVRNVVRWFRPNPPVGALGDKYRPATSDMVIACRSKDRWFDLDAVRTVAMAGNPNGAPPLDAWIIPTAAYKGSHYATFPIELCRIPILSMCPRSVCRECGQPRRRVTTSPSGDGGDRPGGQGSRDSATGKRHVRERTVSTLGWSDCGHDNYRHGVVLDPFAGSGTTLAAAIGHGRNAIGIDLDERNADLARERVGMFLTID